MSGIQSGVVERVDAGEMTPRERELGAIISAYNEVTERLKSAHERLEREVARLREEVAAKNRELERRKRLAALGEMAAGLAHEIRNPLGGIVLFASLLEQDLSDRPDQLKLVGKIHKGVRSLEGIVSDILAFSRPGEVDRRWVRLGSIVDQAVDLAWPRFEQLGVRLDVAESVGPIEVYADAGRLERALLNLLLNGAEACGGGGCVWVRARRAEEEAVEIEVADSGAGIAPEAMERIFNPFFTTKETGTGLGLAIVHRIVESHGGSIQAANRPGGGAAFRIRLPLMKGAAGCVREG